MSKQYRFYYQIGQPVIGNGFVWRRSKCTISAYNLADALNKLAKRTVKRWNIGARLSLEEGYRFDGDKTPVRLNLEVSKLNEVIGNPQTRALLALE